MKSNLEIRQALESSFLHYKSAADMSLDIHTKVVSLNLLLSYCKEELEEWQDCTCACAGENDSNTTKILDAIDVYLNE